MPFNRLHRMQKIIFLYREQLFGTERVEKKSHAVRFLKSLGYGENQATLENQTFSQGLASPRSFI